MNAKVDGLSVYLLDPTRNKDVAQGKELLLIDPQVQPRAAAPVSSAVAGCVLHSAAA